VSRETLLAALAGRLRHQFGALVVARDVRRRRTVVGESWLASLVVPASAGDIVIGEYAVDADGALAASPGVDDVVAAVRRTFVKKSESVRPPPGLPPELADEFADMMVDSTVGAGIDLAEGATSAQAVFDKAMVKGDRATLRGVRDVLPRFLAEGDARGHTLMLMAEVERRLGETQLAASYLEAAARDFSDRFDIDALERCAKASREVLGAEAYARSTVAQLLETNLLRMRPLTHIFESQGLRGLTDNQQYWLENNAVLRALAPGELLVKEGDPAQSVFVVKNGLLAVMLETPSGGQRMIRCCYPGWLLGESSVLGEKGARCTASLRAERPTEVWTIDAGVLSMIMAQNEALKMRISATKHIHRIDSFFSMHETLGQLDVTVRDEVLACLHSIQIIDEDAVAVAQGEVPEFACLVARGELALYADATPDPALPPQGVVGSDQFFGVRDAIHKIACGRTAVARKGSMVVFFDAERLRTLSVNSPPHVVAPLVPGVARRTGAHQPG